MIYINNDCTDPRYNLALEEYMLKNLDSEGNCIMLWQNRPSVIIGKHQNAVEEINIDYVKKNNILVVRRITGGGAVYHDLGNLNFTFIIKNQENTLCDFKRYTQPIVNALRSMGVNAELNNRSDITIDGRKFSGNAQNIFKNKLLHHGTLLFNSDLEVLHHTLKVQADKIVSKSIKSVRSRVTNIAEHLPQQISIGEFKDILLRHLIESENDIHEYVLTDEDEKSINTLRGEKYDTWEWNYGESPSFNFKNSKFVNGRKVDVLLDISRGGLIENCKIRLDFPDADDVSHLENSLKNSRYDYETIKRLLSGIDVIRCFGSVSTEEVLSCFF